MLLTLPAHNILSVIGSTTLFGGILQYPPSSISHGCRYSCWNFMKLQHYFHILLTSRLKSSRTKSIHGLQRNKPYKKTCIHIFDAPHCPPHGVYWINCVKRSHYSAIFESKICILVSLFNQPWLPLFLLELHETAASLSHTPYLKIKIFTNKIYSWVAEK